jgi:hypothetical protein
VVCSLLVAAAIAACGNPGGPTEEFSFDPYPYTVVPTPEPGSELAGCKSCPVAVSISDDCHMFDAGLLHVFTEDESVDEVRDWARGYGFDPLHEQHLAELSADAPRRTSIWLKVPLGAAPHAAAEASRIDGVIEAAPSGIGFIPEYVPAAIKECKEKLRTPASR